MSVRRRRGGVFGEAIVEVALDGAGRGGEDSAKSINYDGVKHRHSEA